jgi:hypothetical protein
MAFGTPSELQLGLNAAQLVIQHTSSYGQSMKIAILHSKLSIHGPFSKAMLSY